MSASMYGNVTKNKNRYRKRERKRKSVYGCGSLVKTWGNAVKWTYKKQKETDYFSCFKQLMALGLEQ